MSQRKKVALIGLGTNAANYRDGLLMSTNLELCAVCDFDENAISRKYYLDTPFFTDFRKIISLHDIQYVFIVTPPKTHFEIARYFIRQGIPVILEKPPFADYKELFRLRGLSNVKQTKWMTAYHWQFGPEVEYLRDEIMPNLGKLISAQTTIFDPYCENGHIHPNKANLLGAWLDSGSNALSVFNFLFRNLKPRILHRTFLVDNNLKMPYFAEVTFEYRTMSFSISIDWTKNINQKRSVFSFEKGVVTIEHSQQTIFLDGVKVAKFDDRPRLVNHYYHMLRDFSFDEMERRKMNSATLKFLYEVNNCEKNF